MVTNSRILNVDGITPEHVNRICEIITKYFNGTNDKDNKEIINC